MLRGVMCHAFLFVWLATGAGTALTSISAAAASLLEAPTPAPLEETGYRAFKFSGTGFPSFNVFLTTSVAELRDALPLIVYVPGSGCASNFRIVDGKAQAGWFDREIRRIAGDAEFVAADRAGVELFAQPGQPGMGSDCGVDYALYSDFNQVAAGLAALVDHLVGRRKKPPQYILVVGASDGAPIAALASALSPSISHVAMISGGGDNQLKEFVLLQSNPLTGKTNENSNDRLRDVFQMFDTVRRTSEESKVLFGHPVKRWKAAFSISVTNALSNAKAAVYLVSSTDDNAVPIASTDLLAASLIAGGKDIVFERIPGADHALRTGPEKSTSRRVEAMRSIVKWASGSPAHGEDVIWPLKVGRSDR